ncbi:tyrosine-type recombinase/integrase [Occallatibacter savannae]|uniref:tyrosine-type recombinase/integrase n=1 Tax=Occallatibacter savannae TaxID=1002691 RepID=UPI000D6A022C
MNANPIRLESYPGTSVLLGSVLSGWTATRNAKGEGLAEIRLGNWLSAEESKALWEAPDPNGLKGKRDRALFALLLACGLRRHEAVSLKLRDLEQREGRWAIVDLIGKGDHVRTVPIPDWVREQLESWIRAAGICEGLIFRRVNRSGQVRGEHISEKAIWHIVRKSARRAGLPNVAPHDLRRTCARLCQSAGGELEQIQFLLGHVSIQTTERYLGSKQRLRCAVNDRIGIEPKP